MWAGGSWRSQPVLRHGSTNGSVSVTASGRAVGLCNSTQSWNTQLNIAADFCKTWSGTRWNWAPTLCHFALIQAKTYLVYIYFDTVLGVVPDYNIREPTGISLTPSCQLSASLVTFFLVKRWMNPLRSQISNSDFLSLFLYRNVGWPIHQMLPLFYVYAKKNFLMQLLASFPISIVSLLNKCIALHYNLSLVSHFVFSRTQR